MLKHILSGPILGASDLSEAWARFGEICKGTKDFRFYGGGKFTHSNLVDTCLNLHKSIKDAEAELSNQLKFDRHAEDSERLATLYDTVVEND
jgi:hypothetical protein